MYLVVGEQSVVNINQENEGNGCRHTRPRYFSGTGPLPSPRRAAGRGASDWRATLPEACGYRRGQVLSESVHTFDAAADQLESSIRSPYITVITEQLDFNLWLVLSFHSPCS